MIKINVIAIAVAVLAWLGGAPASRAASGSEDALVAAMKDEMERSLERLQMEGLDRPYYIALTARDLDLAQTYAEFGAVTSTDADQSRFLIADLRVGDYAFDSTNFIGGGFSASRGSRARLTTDDDYDAIRHIVWLSLDQLYKSALERISVKRAIAKTKTKTERPPDFSKAEPVRVMAEPRHLSLDLNDWQERVRKLSAIFREFPLIQQSGVSMQAFATNHLYVSSEGSQALRADAVFEVKAFAYTQASDGMHVSDSTSFLVKDEKELPSFETAEKSVRALAERLVKLAQSPPMEDYTGPVIFTRAAAAQFFKILLADNLADPVLPLLENDAMADRIRGQKLVTKLGRRVLPPFIDATDDPTRATHDGRVLFGHYPFDDEGVVPQAINLVAQGRLAGYYMSRTPTDKFVASTGHGRYAGFGGKIAGQAGSLFISSTTAEPFGALKEEMLDACRDEDLEYGVIIDSLGDDSGGAFGMDTGLPEPVVIRKVFVKDGHEEWARGGTFGRITPKILREILATANDPYVLNALSGGAGPFAIPYSVVAPSILVKELDLKKSEGEKDKPPLIPHPYFAKGQ